MDTYNVSINIDLENKGNETNVYWIDVLAKDYVGRDTAETSLTKLGPLESNSIMLDNFNALYDNSFYVFQYTLYVRQSDESKKLDSFQTNIVGGGGHPFFRYKTLTRLDDNQALIVNIYNCSSAYDRYLKSILLEFLSNNSFDMPNPLNGPVKIYSNVKNGQGIFASYNIQSQILNNAECI